MATRKGMATGQGSGYKNVIGVDPKVHSESAKGISQPQKVAVIQPNKKTINNPSIEWISIDNEDMMRDTYKDFINFLKKNNVDYISYASEDGEKTYMKLLKPKQIIENSKEFDKEMAQWGYYNPITTLRRPPKVSDYNILEDMSVDPYDIDKWRGTD